MKVVGIVCFFVKGCVIVFVIVVFGIVVFVYVYYCMMVYLFIDDVLIDVDVVYVVLLVGGCIVQFVVYENQCVVKGDLLYVIDFVLYWLIVVQVQVDFEFVCVLFDMCCCLLIGECLNVFVVVEQVKCVMQNYDFVMCDVNWFVLFVVQGYVSVQQFDQVKVCQCDVVVLFVQVQEQQCVFVQMIGDDVDVIVMLYVCEVVLVCVQYVFDDMVVCVLYDGFVMGLSVFFGEIFVLNQLIFMLIDVSEWFVVGNFCEMLLNCIVVGDCVIVYLMIDCDCLMIGKVVGIGVGIVDSDCINLLCLLLIVQCLVNWVYVVQCFLVCVKFDEFDGKFVCVGVSVIVEVWYGLVCC